MSKKTTKFVAFSEKMMNHAKNKLSETKRRVIAKNKYLLNNKENFIQAKAEGYTYSIIAEVATIDFLKSGVSKTFTVKNREGKEMQYETKIRTVDIKNICEPENDK